MPKGEKRLTIEGLIPGEKYAIQVRAVDTDDTSQWSQKYGFETIDDTAGGTRTPTPPVLDTWTIDGAGSYVGTWATNFTNTDGTIMVVKRYELELAAQSGTVIATHYVGSGASQIRSFTLAQLKGHFGGVVPTTITARLRIINSADTASEWSAPLTASLPIPNPPTNPSAESVIDAVKVKWEPPLDPAGLFGYRVYMSMTDENFIPDTAGKSNLVYQGPALEFPYTSLSYNLMHYFKIVSYSEPGLESTWVTASGKPKSPYGPDDIPPLKPVLADPVMDRTVLTAPKANLSWTINETATENSDISGFVIRWRITGDTSWRNSYFDKTARSGSIDLPQPFSNYEFEISAYDFVANYSAYDGTAKTLIAASAPPEAVTGVSGVPRWDGIRIVWDASTESVKYGGRYEVQLKTSNSFPNNVPDYTTSNLFVDVTGLVSLTEYFYRVRAIDSANQAGPWSAVASATLPAFPAASATDGVAPSTAPQNVRATGGLNYVNVAWDRVTNSDAVWYEVFMSVGGAPTATSEYFVGESSGTSLMVASDADGVALVQETEYHFIVRAVDADNPGPVSAEVTSQLTQVLSTDLGINMGGENLLYNSSYDTDSDGNGVADYWQIVNSTAATEPHVASLVTGRNGGGMAQRLSWTGVSTSQKGVKSKDSTVLRANTEYVFSVYARGNGGTIGFSTSPALTSTTTLEAPDLHATEWRRWIFRGTTATPFDLDNITIANLANPNTNGWVEFDDAQIEAGNTASAYKSGTVSIAKLTSGRMSTAEMIIDAAGIVKSSDYNNTTKTGWAIHKDGIDAFKGQVSANTLVANTTIANNLYIGALLEMAAGGLIRSANYNPGVAGYSLSSVGLDIRSGTVGAGTLVAGTISSPDIRVGAGGKVTIDANGSIVSNNYNGPNDAGANSGFKISNVGIEMWDTNSKINVNALETGTMTARTITIGSGGTLASSTWAGGSGARWQLSENAFTMYNGTITGSTIITDQLYSASSEVSPDGVTRRKFSINAGGYAEFSGAYVYGNMIIGTHPNNVVQSGNYNATNTGWRIQGDGLATFFNIQTWGLRVYSTATVGNNSGHHIRSEAYSAGGYGWIIRGDGVAEFWGGTFSVGGHAGGQIRLTNWGSGESLIQFLVPGDWGHYHQIKAEGQNLTIRGGWGGALTFTADTTVRSSLHHAVDYDIWAGRRIDAGSSVGAPVGSFSSLGGDPVFNWVGQTANPHYAYFGASGHINRGNVYNSSKDYKHTVHPLTIKAKDVVALEPKTFYYNEDKHEDMGSGQQTGFMAEDADELGLHHWVTYTKDEDDNLKATGFNYPHFTVAQQVVLREHEERIKALEAKVEKLLRALDK